MEASYDLCSRILSRGPSQDTLLLVLEEMKEQGRLGEVIRGCVEALKVYPDAVRLRRLLAESYFEAGFIGRAEEELERVASELKALSSAMKLQAEIYRRQSRTDEAARALRAYLAHNPDDREASELLERLIPPAELSEERDFQEEEQPEASDPEADFSGLATPTLAEIYFSQGQTDEAVATYEKVLLKNPEDRASRIRLAEIQATLDREAEDRPPLVNPSEKKEKLIAALEGWLSRIQEMNGIR